MSSTFLSLVLISGSILCTRAQSSVTLSANFTDIVCPSITGVGGVRHGFDYMAEETYRGLNSTYRALSLSRICDARLRIARTWYSSDWVMPVWGGAMNFSSERFEQFATWVSDIKACNVTVALQAGWWFTQNVCQQGAPSTCTPNSTDIDTYTKWISASVKELVVTRGLSNVNTLVFFTEPLSYESGNIPPGYTQESFFAVVLSALHNRLVADGLRSLVQIMAPNDGGISTASMLAALQWSVDTLDDYIDVYSSHDYSMSGYSSWFSVLANATAITRSTGKPFLMDEGGDSDEAFRNTSNYGTYIASMHAAAFNAGISATTMWLWQDQYYVWPLQNATNGDSFYNGLHRWGQQPWLPYNTTVRPSYYTLSMLSRYYGPRVQLSEVSSVATTGFSGGVAISALAGNANDLAFRALLIVNENAGPVNVSVALFNFVCNCGDQQLTRFLYDPASPPTDDELIWPSGSYDGNGAPLVDTLPAGGVAVWATV